MIELMNLCNKDNFEVAKNKLIKRGYKDIKLREKWIPPKNKVSGYIKYTLWGEKL